ncbi:MAG: helicase-exonuclease AddAB subunit AddA [Stomatobaculum sp.]|nr:helicase-exonuclease AddAB subunit AddA [Stomatobaculum sp.]
MPEWTAEQERAISLCGRKLLVSAAAGSGKTAVLTERICRRVTDRTKPADIDELLIMTFTRAAAAEMRERIRKRLEEETVKETAEHADSERAVQLKRQLTLLDGARITTIDSFCLSILQEHADLTGLDPSFRVGSEEELSLMRNDILEDFLEEKYEEGDPGFLRFADCFSTGKTDDAVPALLERMRQIAESRPWPEEWLRECAEEAGRTAAGGEAAEESPWIRYIVGDIRLMGTELLKKAEEAQSLCREPDGPAGYRDVVEEELPKLASLCQARTFREQQEALGAFEPWTALKSRQPKTVSEEKKIRVKELRDFWKKIIKDQLIPRFGEWDPETVKADLQEEAETVRVVTELTAEYRRRFAEKKREKNLVDFSDLEHFALEMLWEKHPDGRRTRSALAEEYSSELKEIYVDEYQDSNEVQEQLLLAVTGKELFLVGDVKQSIYGFRLAKPELFLEKYRTFVKDDPAAEAVPEGTDTRVDLSRNFRSRRQVLDTVNGVFRAIMDAPVGGLRYTAEEALYPGAAYPDAGIPGPDPYETELVLADAAGTSGTEKIEAEARVIAEKIRRITDPETRLKVRDPETGELRPAAFGDIVILLRSMRGRAETLVSVLMSEGIPAEAEQSTGYFNALEVKTVLSLLSVIDNPLRDIPLAAVLRSPLTGMTEEEFTELLAGEEKELPLWQRLKNAAERLPGSSGAEKFREAERSILFFADKAVFLSLPDLIRELLSVTGYYAYASALPGGEVRKANLDMLVVKAEDFESTGYRGLYDFVRYIGLLKKYDTDFGEAQTASAQGNSVRIMTIHKSKGLEFPVVFLADMSHKFNTQDTTARVLADQRFGIAAEAADPVNKLRGTTLKKNIFAWHMTSEALGEELRVLYVVMTRAKEKLIMTAAADQPLQLAEAALRGGARERAGFDEVRSQHTYLDWILLAMSVSEDRCMIRVSAEDTEDLEKIHSKELTRVLELRKTLEEMISGNRDVKDLPRFRYLAMPYAFEEDVNLHTKRSVSELKHRGEEEEDEAAVRPEYAENSEEKAASPQKENSAARDEASRRGMLRGTIFHRVMEKLDYQRSLTMPELEKELREWTESGIFTEEELSMIRVSDFRPFFSSPLCGRMRKAALRGTLRREAPFVMTLPAKEVDPGIFSEEPVLIQGVIDAWFEEDGKIVLVDYKTDRGISAEALADRYRLQMEYYRKALRMMEDKEVGETILWSFALGEAISL